MHPNEGSGARSLKGLTRLVGIAATILLLLVQSAVAIVHASPSGAEACSSGEFTGLEISRQESQSTTAAIFTAESSPILQQAAAQALGSAVRIELASTFDSWALNGTECSVTLKGVGVAFDLTSGNGSATATVLEPSSMTRVLSVNVSMNTQSASAYARWAGYEFEEFSEDWNTMTYTEPAVSLPHAGTCGSYPYCAVWEWAGLTNDSVGADGIAQTGTYEEIEYGGFGIWVHVYEAWYEWAPSGAVNCFSVTPGDAIVPTVYYTGSDDYHMTLNDLTTNKGCSESQTDASIGTPNYAQYMVEEPVYCGGGYGCYNPNLPKFGQVDFTIISSGMNGAPVENEWRTTGNTDSAGNAIVNLPLNYYSNITGCDNTEWPPGCFGLHYQAPG